MNRITRYLPFQPEPRQVLVSRSVSGPDVVTAITRIWNPGDTARCRLCPTCSADLKHSVCMLQVRGMVTDAEALHFDATGDGPGEKRFPSVYDPED